MIIDKLEPLWTEEEKARLRELNIKQNELLSGSELKGEEIKKFEAITDEISSLEASVEKRYIQSKTKKEILNDVKEIVSAITKADFQNYISESLEAFKNVIASEANEQFVSRLKEILRETYQNCYRFISNTLAPQYTALGYTEETVNAIGNIIEAHIASWYVKPIKSHYPVPYSRPTGELAFITTKKIKIDPISGDATVERPNVQFKFSHYNDIKGSLGISLDKLLNTALAKFAEQNDFSKGSKKANNRKIDIPLKEYAHLLGYDVNSKTSLDNARKKILKALELLYNLSFEWAEVIRGKEESFSSVRLLTAKAYKGGMLSMTFTPEMADYLVGRGILTQYNTAFLKLDERKPTSYFIGRKLEAHYNMDANQNNHRHNRIKIKTLLKDSGLPSYETVEKTDRGHWERRIKEPFEEGLDYLTKENILKSWEYCHAKGIPLTEQEASNITDYATFESLYLLFEPVNKVDHSQRQERRKAERKKKK